MTDVALNFDLWPRQLEALRSRATEILFGGASEGGKSHLVRVLLCSLCLAIPNLQCILIRKKFDDILKNHVAGPTGFRTLLKPLTDLKLVKITESGIEFPRGSNIGFQHCQDERQFTSAQGVEKHVLVIDEATQIPESLIRMFRAWVRMPIEFRATLPEEYRDKLPLIVYTANPIGPSVGYFRRNFVNARPAFAIEEVNGFLRQYIPSRAIDNRSIDIRAHSGRLADLNDEALARALDEGDWDAPVGDYFRDYDDARHTIEDFTPPTHWFKFRTFDWGSSDPFCVLWWCVADGNEFFDLAGRRCWVPRGSLIAYREWYGCDETNPSHGLGMRNEDVASGILTRTQEVMSGLTIADSLPFQDRGFSDTNKIRKKYTIADVFAEGGVPLTRGNTDRVFGSSQVRSRLKGQDSWPTLYLARSCEYTRDYLPAVQQDPSKREAYVQDGEATHSTDCVRYACATKPIVQDAPKAPAGIVPKRTSDTPSQLLRQIQAQKGGRRGRR